MISCQLLYNTHRSWIIHNTIFFASLSFINIYNEDVLLGGWQKITAIGELPQARLEKDLLAQQEMRQLDKKLKDSRKANASAVSRRGWERMGTRNDEIGGPLLFFIYLM